MRYELSEAASEGNITTWRLRWVAVLAILRAVGHVLRNIDARRSSEMHAAIAAAWQRWDQSAFQHLIFHEFIKRQRDNILKEYRFDTATIITKDSIAASKAIGPDSVLLIGDRTYSALGAVDSSIAWWESELDKIENNAG